MTRVVIGSKDMSVVEVHLAQPVSANTIDDSFLRLASVSGFYLSGGFDEPFVYWSTQVQAVFKEHGRPDRRSRSTE